MKSILIVAAAMLVAMETASPHAQQGRAVPGLGVTDAAAGAAGLLPTNHPPLPRDASVAWLSPDRGLTGGGAPTTTSLAGVVKLVTGGEFSKAFSIAAQPSLQQGPLGLYAAYYAGVAQLRLDRPAEALRTFKALGEQKPQSYLIEAAALGEAEAHLALDDPAAAVLVYERLVNSHPTHIEDVLLRLGRAARAAGDPSKAADAFGRVYYEFALTDLAVTAGSELATMKLRPVEPGSPHFQLELGRAERLFGAKQYDLSRSAFEFLLPLSTGEDRTLVRLRLAESDYYQKRFRAARDRVKPLVDDESPRKGEALFFFAAASKSAGDLATYLDLIPRIVREFPRERWAEEALNSLASHYLAGDDDERTARAFRDLYEAFPRGLYAERAAWKAGWYAYRTGQLQDTVRIFERASLDFPRSDYRPSWLYWSGRAHERLDDGAASGVFALVAADYFNSYYGRLASARLGGTAAAAARATKLAQETGPRDVALAAPLPTNAPTIRALLGAEMYDDALNELEFARTTWGDSSALQATEAWTRQQQSRSASGTKRFQLARGAINSMRRAYPQFLAVGGEELPRDVLRVIYPLAYWDLIRRYAAQYDLDPHLMAALVAQESTFVADIRSGANAYGLMQLMPATAREYARKLKIPYSTRLLTDPDANIHMGTAFFADRLKEFGDLHLVLASYNAGPASVRRWIAQRPGLDKEEFIDDIPYPETQGYVRKILGTAEDYRRLYGDSEGNIEPAENQLLVAASVASPAQAAPASAAPAPQMGAPKAPPRKPRVTKRPAARTRKS